MNVHETIKYLETGDDVDKQIVAFNILNETVSDKDLSILLEAIKSESSNFFVREILSEPIIRLGGVKVLPELLTAFQKNFDEGHDNDSFQLFLTELAEEHPNNVKRILKELSKNATKPEMENIEWLLEYCE